MVAVAMVSESCPMKELLDMAGNHKAGNLALSETESELLIAIIKEKAWQELEYGEEMVVDKVKLVKRVTGNVSLFFSKN